jgi:hypothetical protein
MADLQVTLTFPDVNKVADMESYLRIHPNIRTIDDPAWVDPEDGTEAPQIPEYTDGQWVKQHIVEFVRTQIIRGRVLQHKDAENIGNADYIT